MSKIYSPMVRKGLLYNQRIKISHSSVIECEVHVIQCYRIIVLSVFMMIFDHMPALNTGNIILL